MKNIKNMNLQQWLSRPFVTYLFLGIQAIIFLLMEIGFRNYGGSQNAAVLLEFGAMNRAAVIINHEWWRFLAPIFIHIGWAHILVNSITLYFLGSQVEMIFGHGRYALIYLLSGISGNAVSFCFNDGISAGASTSLFGLFATYLVLAKIHHHDPYIRALARSYGMFLLLNLVMNLFTPGVDIFGHLGGLLGGLLSSYALSLPRIGDQVNIHTRIIAGILYVFMVVVLILWGYQRAGYPLF